MTPKTCSTIAHNFLSTYMGSRIMFILSRLDILADLAGMCVVYTRVNNRYSAFPCVHLSTQA